MMNQVIDYKILSDAIAYYENLGYKYVEVPWFVPAEINNVTKPAGVRGFHIDCDIFDGELVGSGEQSFIHLMSIGKLESGKYMCVTPCFRDEPNGYDELHQPYFMKAELINTKDVNDDELDNLTDDAYSFMSKHIEADVDYFHSTNSFDIVSAKDRIELGSYGIRIWNEFKWIYGSGVALPRLSIAMEKARLYNE